MKHHARAAFAAFALTVIPGAVLAGNLNGTGYAVAYNVDEGDLVTHQTGFNYEHLQVLQGAVFSGVDNPDLFAPDSPCRSIARAWNLYVVQGKSAAYFSKLLVQLSANTCRVGYTRSDTAGPDGLFLAYDIHPIP